MQTLLCCCMAPLAGLVTCIPGTAVIAVVWPVTTLVHTPKGTMAVYQLLWATKRLGPFAKSVMGLLLLLPVVLAVPLAFLTGALCGFGIGFAEGFAFGMGSGGKDCGTWMWSAITQYHQTAGLLPSVCHTYAVERLPPGYEPFELNPFRAVTSLLCGLLGGAAGMLGFTVAALVYAIPTVLAMLRGSTRAAMEMPACCCCYVIFVAVAPILYLLFICLNPIAGLLAGAFKSITVCYSSGAARAAAVARADFERAQDLRAAINASNRPLLADELQRGVDVCLSSTLLWRPTEPQLCQNMHLALRNSPFAPCSQQPALTAQILSHAGAPSLFLMDCVCTFFARGQGSECGQSVTEIAARLQFEAVVQSWSFETAAGMLATLRSDRVVDEPAQAASFLATIQCQPGESWKRLLTVAEDSSVAVHFERQRPTAMRALQYLRDEPSDHLRQMRQRSDGHMAVPLAEVISHELPDGTADTVLPPTVGLLATMCDFLGLNGFWHGWRATQELVKWRFKVGADAVQAAHTMVGGR